MAVCARCATQLPGHPQVCTGCGLILNTAAASAPAVPTVAAPVMPPPAAPPIAEMPLPATPVATPAPRYGVPLPIERPSKPIMPPNPFAKGAQTDRGPVPPQLPVRHESAAIPVAFAQFSEPAVAGNHAVTADPAEVVILRPSLAEALEAALADLPADAPDHVDEEPEPFPEVLTIAPPKAAMPGWS